MANETTTTSVNDTINSVLVQNEVIDSAWSNLVCQPLIMERDISGQLTNAAQFPKMDSIAAAAVAESADLTPTEQTTTSVTLTASEVGVMVLVKDRVTRSSLLSNLASFSAQLGKAVADKIDTDIAALFAGFSNSVGSSGVNLTEQNVLDAIATLEIADAPTPFVLVLHPQQIADWRSILATSTGVINFNVNSQMIGVQNKGYFGNRYGVDVYSTTNVATANTGADRAGAMFSKGLALGIVFKKAIGIEFQRDASARGTEIVCTSDYGVGEIVDSYGVKVVTDA